ncbi:MAG: carboxypeptidase regulatory-like domain-containing protein [Desulfobacteraceae bacterium]|nr:carboxypeptidase regulatory-like domain-containing protein [Desulfobacteraceae bacterium]
MKGYGILIDVAKCSGCYNCMLACKDEHCGETFPGYSEAQPMTGQFWINVNEKERGSYSKIKVSFTPITCMHCRNAPCIKAAENNAVYRRDDGIVIIDPEKAAGQKQIVSACPYRVIFWNEEKNTPQKCTGCAHLLDQGYQRPRCVEMCPTGALSFVDADELKSSNASSIHPEYGLGERVLYLNIPKKFIAGTVVYGETDQCAKEVTVTLKGGGTTVSAVTDGFGDFWFNDVESMTDYELEIEQDGFKKIKRQVRTYGDINVGELFLEKIA